MKETIGYLTPELVKALTKSVVVINGILGLALLHYAGYLLYLVYTAIAG